VAVSFFTYGLGGLVYWLARRGHLICPRCGLGWEHAPRALPSGSGGDGNGRPTEASSAVPELPSAGGKRRFLGVVLALVATLLVLVGIVEGELAAMAVGSVLGAAGSLSYYWGWRGLQDRRSAVLEGVQRRVLQLATSRGGTLTVTEVAAALDLSIAGAEKVLTEMDDGFRVRSEISPEGILYYEFPEVRLRRELPPGA